MQVLISFTLNLTKDMTQEELHKLLDEECPMVVDKDAPFKVSTERWDRIEVD